MTVYGVLTQKSSIQNPKFNNRYYMQASSLAQAIAYGVSMSTWEQTIFGSLVDFTNIHAWQPFTSPNVFDNQPLTALGDVTATNPIASWICAEVVWPVPGSYPHYKRYRVQLDASALNGLGWNTSMQTMLTDFVSGMEEFDGILCTLQGVPLGTPSWTLNYVPNQVGKKWHNRATPE